MRSQTKLIIISLLICFLLYPLFFIYLDKRVILWVYATFPAVPFNNSGNYISLLAHGLIVKLALVVGIALTWLLDPFLNKQWARNIAYVCAACAIAIIIGDGLKYFFGRYRPVMLFEHDLYGFHFFASNWQMQSSPSGHTIRAFSLMTALSKLFPRFLMLFMPVAVIIGMSRVVLTAHYPSDILFGACIGIITAIWTHNIFFSVQDG